MEGRTGLTIAPGGLEALLSALISVQAEGSTWTHRSSSQLAQTLGNHMALAAWARSCM